MLHQMPTTAAAPLTSPTGAATARWRWRPTTASGVATPRLATATTPKAMRPTRPNWRVRNESLTAFLHRQALALRLSEVDSAALRFLIESLNDDGYLEESLQELAIALAGPDDLEQIDELVHRFTVAQRLLQTLEPVGVGARNLAECLTLQLQRSGGRCAQRRAARRGADCAANLPATAGNAGPPRCAPPHPGLHRRRCCGRRAHPRRHGPDCPAGATPRAALCWMWSATSSCPM